jgi:hypothetical protein
MKAFRIFKKLLSDFRNDKRGAIAWITIVAGVPLIMLMFYMVNSAKAIQDQTRTQDAADMIALVHAAEAARSLNTISMNQVTMTQAFASGVTSGTLFDVTVQHIARVVLAEAAIALFIVQTCNKYLDIPYVGAILFATCSLPADELAIEVGINGVKAGLLLSKYDPLGAFNIAKKTVKALNKMNEELVNRFPQAVSVAAKQIAQSAKVTDIYFDDSCAQGIATSCDSSNKRQGMELPIVKDKQNEAYYTFCAALHFGTGGFDLGSIIPGLPSVGGSLMNGSYVKRGFPILKGPMYGGKSNEHLRDFINDETDIGKILKKYWDLAERKQLYDGNTIIGFLWGDSLGDKGLQYPYEQKEDSNLFTDWVDLKIALQCLGAASIPGLSQILSVLGALTHDVPKMDLYYPIDDGGSGFSALPDFPKIQPGIDDYSDHYKPLAFVYRKSNKRWMPKVFKDTNKGFYAYSEALVFNPDEIGLYSQNWQSRLIPAKKMETLSSIVSRMGSKAPSDFSDLKTDLQSVQGDSSWSEVVAK